MKWQSKNGKFWFSWRTRSFRWHIGIGPLDIAMHHTAKSRKKVSN